MVRPTTRVGNILTRLIYIMVHNYAIQGTPQCNFNLKYLEAHVSKKQDEAYASEFVRRISPQIVWGVRSWFFFPKSDLPLTHIIPYLFTRFHSNSRDPKLQIDSLQRVELRPLLQELKPLPSVVAATTALAPVTPSSSS